VIPVAKITPKASETAMGIRNCAWTLRSSISGVSPAKVVSEVSTIGRKRPTPAAIRASRIGSPPARRALTLWTSTRLAFTTTPESATIPTTDMKHRSMPRIRWPAMAPTSPKGMTLMMMSGWE